MLTGIGIGVPFTRRRGFSAGDLFANSEVGVWYDPSDFSTMFQDSAGTTPVTAVEQPVGKILDKSGNGYHATQATSTARPVLRARYNLLTYSEQFDNAAWTKLRGTIVANTTTAPDGTLTADTLVQTAGQTILGLAFQQFTTVTGGTYTTQAKFKKKDKRYATLSSNSMYSDFDLDTGLVGTIAAGHTGTMTSLGDGWYLCTTTYTETVGGLKNFGVTHRDTTGSNTVTDSGGTYIWGAQLNHGSPVTPYQRIAAATDYDTAGFLQASDYDGVDDSNAQPAGGGSTTAFFLCAGVKVEGGAGTARTLWSDAGTNTGYIVRLNASNQLELAAGNATAYTTIATVATLSVGTAYVVTAWDDGTNLNVQVNNGAVASVARPVVSAGTATASIGSDNGSATGWFNGLVYSLIQVKNDAGTDAERASTKAYVASKAGVTL